MAHVLPGDASTFHHRYTSKFNSWYGEGIDATQIYIHCGNNFVKFHAVFPTQAWLLERLCRIYKNVDISLDAFQAKYDEEFDDTTGVLLSTKYKDNDPFTYFQDIELDLLHRKVYVGMIAALKTHKEGLMRNVFQELARSLLQIACEEQRRELLNELTSQETFDTLSAVHVSASTNIYTVRSAIVLQEEMFAMNIARIRETLAESERGLSGSASELEEGTPASSAAPSQAPLAPIIRSTEAGGSGSGSGTYTVARSGEALEWTVRRS